jgi:hypothetical protein
MKISKYDRDRALIKLSTERGLSTHEAIQTWLKMPQKEQRELVAKTKLNGGGSRWSKN